MAASCGDIVRCIGRPSPYLINSPEAIKHIFITNESNYTKEGSSFKRAKSALGCGLLTNSGAEWKASRDATQSQFHYKHLTPYLPAIAEKTTEFLDSWEERANTTVDLVHEMSTLVFEISAMTLFGADVHKEVNATIPMIRFMNDRLIKTLFINTKLPLPKYRRYHRYYNILNNLMVQMLCEPHPYAADLKPALDAFWYTPGLDEAEKQRRLDEAKNFMIAGHETTAAALSWTLYLLAKNPDCYAQLQHEIDTVLDDSSPTLEQLDQLPYTEMVINEAMRLYPPIWVIERVAIDDDIVSNYLIPKNSIVLICPYTIHRHPAHWNNPEEFNPENFNDENRRQRHKNAYIPFGTGPRVCIGKQLAMLMMKTILPMLLQRFRIGIHPHFEVDIDPLVTLKPATEIPNLILPR